MWGEAHSYDLLRVRSQQCAGDPSIIAHNYSTYAQLMYHFRTLLFLCGCSPVVNFETQSRSGVGWCEAEFIFISLRGSVACLHTFFYCTSRLSHF